jgi:hypothetical protein
MKCLSLILVLIVSAGIIACEKKPQPHKKLSPEEIQKLEERIEGEPAALLSSKYNIDTHNVLELLIDLDKDKHDITKDKLLAYSQKYQIKIDVIAAIIIDSRSMSHPDCSCSCPGD